MEFYVARDKADNRLWLYKNKPFRAGLINGNPNVWGCVYGDRLLSLPGDMFPELLWECEPVKVELVPSEDGGWISVKDRLPEEDQWVVSFYKGVTRPNVYQYVNAGFGNVSIGQDREPCTHWMPIPDPPKE